MKCFAPALGLVFLLFTAGCASSGLPRGAYPVGGGLKINYDPGQEGTIILMDKASGRIIATQTAPTTFDFDATTPNDADIVNAVIGSDWENARFILYFVPERGR